MRLSGFVLALCACGRIGFDRGSGPGPDPDPDAPVGPDQVRVRAFGPAPRVSSPAAGVRVWSSAPAGELLEQGLTDAAGEVVLGIEQGGSVTGVFEVPGAPAPIAWFQTRLDVRSGETVELGIDAPGICNNAKRGSATVTWETMVGATSYSVGGGCGETSTDQLTLDWNLTAETPDPAVVVVRAFDDSNVVLATAVSNSVALPDGASVGFTGLDWQAPVDVTFEMTGLPAVISKVELAGQFFTPNATIPDAGRASVTQSTFQGGVTAIVGAPAVADRVQIEHVMRAADGTALFVARAPLGAPGPIAIASIPPRFTVPAFDVAARRVAWTIDTAGTSDATEILLALGEGTGDAMLWTMHGPGDLTSATLPATPPGLLVDLSSQLFVVAAPIDYDGIAGWDAARALPTWELIGSLIQSSTPRLIVFGTEGAFTSP